MTFQALVVSADDNAAKSLNPVLAAFGLAVQRSGNSADAFSHLATQKFDLVLADLDDADTAPVLAQVQQATSGARTVTVALLSDKNRVRSAFGAGANFVLYKPIAREQAHTCLRAAMALLKRERRRAFRVSVQFPVQLNLQDGSLVDGIVLDLSEGGMDVLAAQPLCPATRFSFRLTLPDRVTKLDAEGHVAWAQPNGQTGVRFIHISESARLALREWLAAYAPEAPPEEAEPVSQCRLTDLSLGGCYVETESPFPERAWVDLCLKAKDMEVHAQGLVRVMHPGHGMGMEFASRTAEQRRSVERFIDFLTSQPGTVPQLLLSPRSLQAEEEGEGAAAGEGEELEDSLLHLLRNHHPLSQQEFLEELQRQRGSAATASS